jgi:hypothetical protein
MQHHDVVVVLAKMWRQMSQLLLSRRVLHVAEVAARRMRK